MSARWWWATSLVAAALLAGGYLWWTAEPDEAALGVGWTATVGVVAEAVPFAEPFGVAVAPDGTTYVADGVGGNRVVAITRHGFSATLAGGREGCADGDGAAARFRAPSAIAIDADGTLYVADTGNDAIRRITPDGLVTTLASGLNGPMGVAVDGQGRVLASDTYSDRIVAIDPGGNITPVPVAVALDTPTGIAWGDGTLYVADTGNRAVHAVAADGSVTTFDAADAGGLHRPIGVAVDAEGTLYVSDEAGRIFEIPSARSGGTARVLAGGATGYRNGLGHEAQFRRPAGLASIEPGRLIAADAGNALLRRIVATARAEMTPPPSPRIAPGFDVGAFIHRPLLWPLEPLSGPFEIAGTIGEARGTDAGRFHAGIDVRADNGTPVLAVRDGVIAPPLATGDFGTLNEWLRLGELAYVHVRVGRTLRGELTDDRRFVATRDMRGRITRVRVKRGARFHVGDVIGSVNPFNHVHLNVGWGGEEYNPLLFRLVQFEDTIPPTIAPNGIQFLDAQGTALVHTVNRRVQLTGQVQIVVDAWDQADGNRPNRRLGVYSLGYQVLQADGTPAPGFDTMRETIRFDQLVPHPDAARLVYAQGSGIPFYGERRTRFLYIVTNRFRDGVAAPGMWDTTALPPGDYIVRVRVADVNGNEALERRDVPVTISAPLALTGASPSGP